MFKREKLFGSNFNDWFRSPKMVLRVEKKLFVIKQPISPSSPADSMYLRSGMRFHNEVAYLMIKSMTPKLHGQLKNSSPYEMLQELKSMFGKQDGFKRNYNMHNLGKTIGELHALLIKYEKGLPKKAARPQVMAIQEAATRILNMVPTKKVDKTPYELWIPKETIGYYIYFPPKNKIVVASYAKFLEKNLLSQEISGMAEEVKEI
nr:hypothetical protein [Tanacetum cinerariifolium]